MIKLHQYLKKKTGTSNVKLPEENVLRLGNSESMYAKTIRRGFGINIFLYTHAGFVYPFWGQKLKI